MQISTRPKSAQRANQMADSLAVLDDLLCNPCDGRGRHDLESPLLEAIRTGNRERPRISR